MPRRPMIVSTALSSSESLRPGVLVPDFVVTA